MPQERLADSEKMGRVANPWDVIRPASPFRSFRFGGFFFRFVLSVFTSKPESGNIKKPFLYPQFFLTETTTRPFLDTKKRDRFLGLSLGVNHDGVVLVMRGNFTDYSDLLIQLRIVRSSTPKRRAISG